MSRHVFSCWFVVLLAAFVGANLLWIGDRSPHKGFPLPYAWEFRGQPQSLMFALLPNAVVALGISTLVAWGMARRRSRQPASEPPPSPALHAEREKPGIAVTAAWLLLSPLGGLLLGGAIGWCLLGGILTIAGFGAVWSLSFGFLGALFGAVVGAPMGLLFALARKTDILK